MAITRASITCVAASLAVAAASATRAGEISGLTWFSGVASVAGESFSTPNPNNDNIVDAPLNPILVTQKDYTAIGPVDLVFDVAPSGGVTEYRVMEGVQNNTGIDWTGYHLELGFGTGASFTKSPSGDGLDFDSPDFDSALDFDISPGAFPVVTDTEDDIIAGGGVMPDFTFRNFEFHLDVPDGITRFTLRQSPLAAAIPEPSGVALVALGLLSSGVARRRRRRV